MMAIAVAPAATSKSITIPKPRKMMPTTSTTHHTLATSPTASDSVWIVALDAHPGPPRRPRQRNGATGAT